MVTTPTLWKGLTQANTTDAAVGAGGTALQYGGPVVALRDGGYVVVWRDDSRAAFNPSGTAIVGQKYNVLGEKVGGEVKLSFYETGNQWQPAATLLSDGTIAVAITDTIGGFSNLYVRRFDADLNLVGHDGITTGATQAGEPTITAFAGGNYLISYKVGTGADTDIVARVMTAGGITAQFDINNEADNSEHPQSATLSNGNAVIVFQDEFGGSSTDIDIKFAIVTPATVVTVPATTVSGAGGGDPETNPDVAALKGGGFAVVWSDNAGGNIDIRATIYDNAGSVVNDNSATGILVNTSTTGTQTGANVVALADGGFVVTWNDGNTDLVRAQRFNATGTKIGVEFTVKSGIFNWGDNPEAALLSDGRIVYALKNGTGGGTDYDVLTSIWDPRTSPINGTAGNDALTSRRDGATVNGLAGNDKLYGLGDRDVLKGGSGNDVLIGGSDKDTLRGGTGNDVLTGGKHRDIMFGDAGRDDFDFNKISETKRGSERDKINNFQRGQDDIDLRTIDAKTGVGGNQKFKWIGKSDFHDKKGELRYEDKGSKVIVQGDVNGDGKADFEIYVDAGSLSKGDFLL